MKHIYSITDSSDGSLLTTIATETKCATKLASIKKNTDRIWYAASNDGEETLSKSDIELIDNTVNGDWLEIFEALLKTSNTDYELVTVTEI